MTNALNITDEKILEGLLERNGFGAIMKKVAYDWSKLDKRGRKTSATILNGSIDELAGSLMRTACIMEDLQTALTK